MSEEEWITCTTCRDTGKMQDYLPGKGSPRQLRLFACACCRRIEALLSDPRSRRALMVAEQHADGRAGDEAISAAREEADQAVSDIEDATDEGSDGRLYEAALSALWSVIPAVTDDGFVELASHAAFYALGSTTEPSAEAEVQGRMLCDIMDKPPRLSFADPSWLTPNVVGVAKGIYEDRAFDRLPILADALMDAGCFDADILEHCRETGEHVRGCWVVDLVLGME
jgi:hypothetical protein